MDLIVEPRGAWTLLTLDRPGRRNALATPLLAALAEALDRLAADDACRVAVMTGAGGHFAAGADLDEIAAKGSAESERDPRAGLWGRVRGFPKPLVAAVDGMALGGGFELALMADALVLGATARVGLPETSLGLVPGAGGGQRLMARVGPARAARMVMLGEVVDAATAFEWGVAGWLAEGPALPLAEEVAGRLAARAPLAMAAAKRALVAAEGALALAEERAGFVGLMGSEDKAEGIAAFRERRAPEWRGR